MSEIELKRYTGLSPQRVGKDAKYTVTATGSIRLEYQESRRVRYLLTTDEHPELAGMVNRVKQAISGQDGGAFYINEFFDVLVPDGKGGPCFWAGTYDDLLEFEDAEINLKVSPEPGPEVRPGDLWLGPHVGIPYVLNAGATDIRYEKVNGRRRETVYLSDAPNDASRARALASRLGKHKGMSGGRIFINERFHFFAPVESNGDWEYRYLGELGEDQWFMPEDGFERE